MEMNQQEYDLIYRMTAESGEMWRESRSRTHVNSEVVICKHPKRAFYLSWVGNTEGNINGWAVAVRPLEKDHASEFYSAFGSHYYYWFGSVFQDGKFLIASQRCDSATGTVRKKAAWLHDGKLGFGGALLLHVSL